ncbi:MAG: hypothetical protein ACREJC_14625 [Tepidisphaeraceae bacterium]
MSRVQLVHWNAAEARELAAPLVRAGFRVDCKPPSGPGMGRALRTEPPAALIISLERLPSHGREAGVFVRQTRATRHIPLVFVGGAEDKVARVRQLLPDATYTDWGRLVASVRQAIKSPLANLHAPKAFDAYAGRTLPQKLGIKPNSVVAVFGAGDGFAASLLELPDGARFIARKGSRCDLTIWFLKSRVQLDRELPRITRQAAHGPLWLAWPKQTSGVKTDLTQQHVRESGLNNGLVDYKICSIDATWSGLLFRPRAKR